MTDVSRVWFLQCQHAVEMGPRFWFGHVFGHFHAAAAAAGTTTAYFQFLLFQSYYIIIITIITDTQEIQNKIL